MADGVGAELVVLGRVAAAAALGGALGWERLTSGKWAGARTLMLVALSSALFVGVSALAVTEAQALPADVKADPIRAIQAVALGIGFLGAGIIHVERRDAGSSVRGLTTAASVWATAAIGIAAGLGKYVLAVCVTILVLLILRVVGTLEPGATD